MPKFLKSLLPLAVLATLLSVQTISADDAAPEAKSTEEPAVEEVVKEEEPGEDVPRVSLAVAQDRARIMHDVYISSMEAMHHRYFHGDRAVAAHTTLADGRPGRITFRDVFVCGGAIQSPALLQRSGVRGNIGRSLDVSEATVRSRLRRMEDAGILRIADALDRGHRSKVRHIDIQNAPGKVSLTPHGSGDLALEVWTARRKAELFEKTFEVALDFEIGESRGPVEPVI